MLTITEITDPFCSLAWGSEPKRRRLQWLLGEQVRWRRVLGDLIDPEEPGWHRIVRAAAEETQSGDQPVDLDPTSTTVRSTLSAYWSRSGAVTGMPWPAALSHAPTRSRPASIVVKAAEEQGPHLGEAVLRRLREATFVLGEPPDTLARAMAAAGTVPGLDPGALEMDVQSDAVLSAVDADREEARSPNEYVRSLGPDVPGGGHAQRTRDGLRYEFPTFVFTGPAGERTVPGWRPWPVYQAAVAAVAPDLSLRPDRRPSPREVFDRWPVVSPAELRALCGEEATPPEDATRYECGGGWVWTTPGSGLGDTPADDVWCPL